MSSNAKPQSFMSKSKSWADVDNDDFFAQVAQDKPKASPTASWGARPAAADKPEKKSAATAGVPWSFPNPVPQQQQQQQQQQSSPTSAGVGARFDSLSPNFRRSAPLGNWRR